MAQPFSGGSGFGNFDKEKFAAQAHKKFVRMVEAERNTVYRQALAHAAKPSSAVVAPLTVVVRKRPLNGTEKALGQYDVVSCPDGRSVVVHEPKVKYDLTQAVTNHRFAFDAAYGEGACTLDVYRDLLRPRVLNLDRGGQVTAFAYGQTGSGKSFTMTGLVDAALEDVFRLVLSSSNRPRRLVVCLSYYELYCSKVYDLLRNRAPLTLREDETGSVQVVGLSEHGTRDIRIARELLARGAAARSIGTTKVNADSSRSHSVLQLLVREGADGEFHGAGGRDGVDGASAGDGGYTGTLGRLVGKASLVDLAGSEQAHESAPPDKATHHEAAEINKSLLALKECIRAMARGQAQGGAGAGKGIAMQGVDTGYGDDGDDEEEGAGAEAGAGGGGGVRKGTGAAGGKGRPSTASGGAKARRPHSASAGLRRKKSGTTTASSGPGAGMDSGWDFQFDPYSLNNAAIAGRPLTRQASWNPKAGQAVRKPHVHIPFRGSKLTQILRDCFTCPGAVTIMIATVGPGDVAADHTLNTLRYADRLKGIGAAHQSGMGMGAGASSIAAAASATGITTGALADNRAGIKVGLLSDGEGGGVVGGAGATSSSRGAEEGDNPGSRRGGSEVLPGGFTHTDPRRHIPPPGLTDRSSSSGAGAGTGTGAGRGRGYSGDGGFIDEQEEGIGRDGPRPPFATDGGQPASLYPTSSAAPPRLGLLPVTPSWAVGASPPTAIWEANQAMVEAMRREAALADGEAREGAGQRSIPEAPQGGTATANASGGAGTGTGTEAGSKPASRRPSTAAGRPSTAVSAAVANAGLGGPLPYTSQPQPTRIPPSAPSYPTHIPIAHMAKGEAMAALGAAAALAQQASRAQAQTQAHAAVAAGRKGSAPPSVPERALPTRSHQGDSMIASRSAAAASRPGSPGQGTGPEQGQLMALLDAQIQQLEALKSRMAVSTRHGSSSKGASSAGDAVLVETGTETWAGAGASGREGGVNTSRLSVASGASGPARHLEAAVHTATAAAGAIHSSVERSLASLDSSFDSVGMGMGIEGEGGEREGGSAIRGKVGVRRKLYPEDYSSTHHPPGMSAAGHAETAVGGGQPVPATTGVAVGAGSGTGAGAGSRYSDATRRVQAPQGQVRMAVPPPAPPAPGRQSTSGGAVPPKKAPVVVARRLALDQATVAAYGGAPHTTTGAAPPKRQSIGGVSGSGAVARPGTAAAAAVHAASPYAQPLPGSRSSNTTSGTATRAQGSSGGTASRSGSIHAAAALGPGKGAAAAMYRDGGQAQAQGPDQAYASSHAAPPSSPSGPPKPARKLPPAHVPASAYQPAVPPPPSSAYAAARKGATQRTGSEGGDDDTALPSESYWVPRLSRGDSMSESEGVGAGQGSSRAQVQAVAQQHARVQGTVSTGTRPRTAVTGTGTGTGTGREPPAHKGTWDAALLQPHAAVPPPAVPGTVTGNGTAPVYVHATVPQHLSSHGVRASLQGAEPLQPGGPGGSASPGDPYSRRAPATAHSHAQGTGSNPGHKQAQVLQGSSAAVTAAAAAAVAAQRSSVGAQLAGARAATLAAAVVHGSVPGRGVAVPLARTATTTGHVVPVSVSASALAAAYRQAGNPNPTPGATPSIMPSAVILHGGTTGAGAGASMRLGSGNAVSPPRRLR